jgi:hypothetical protein
MHGVNSDAGTRLATSECAVGVSVVVCVSRGLSRVVEYEELKAQYQLLQMEWSAARKAMSDRSSQMRLAESGRQAPAVFLPPWKMTVFAWQRKRRDRRMSTPQPSGYVMTGDEVLSIYQGSSSTTADATTIVAGDNVDTECEEIAGGQDAVVNTRSRGILRRRGPDQVAKELFAIIEDPCGREIGNRLPSILLFGVVSYALL